MIGCSRAWVDGEVRSGVHSGHATRGRLADGSCSDGATSRRGAERRGLGHAWPVIAPLEAAVESPVLDHLEGNVRVAVVDAFFARGPGDHRENPYPEAVDESGF